jgi:hypothetical protein
VDSVADGCFVFPAISSSFVEGCKASQFASANAVE